MSADGKVTLYVAPRATVCTRIIKRNVCHTNCPEIDVLLVGLISVPAVHCERLSQARDGFQIPVSPCIETVCMLIHGVVGILADPLC